MAKQDTSEKLIAALISTGTIKQAAKAAGMSESAIYRKLKDPDFNKMYAEARHNLIDHATAQLQALLSEAVEQFKNAIHDKDAPITVKLQAANDIIRHSIKMTEQTCIIARLEALEELYNE